MQVTQSKEKNKLTAQLGFGRRLIFWHIQSAYFAPVCPYKYKDIHTKSKTQYINAPDEPVISAIFSLMTNHKLIKQEKHYAPWRHIPRHRKRPISS